MLKRYFIYLPSVPGSLDEEWEQCRKQIIETWSAGNRPLKLNIFVDQPDFETFLNTRKSISKSVFDTFGVNCPALNITIQPPEKPFKVAVEAAFIISNSVKVTGKSFHSIPYIVLESETGKEIWAGGVSSYLYPDDTKIAAENAFDLMGAILDGEQMSLNHLVRQWNYIGNILTIEEGFQNYQIFNEVRSDYYHRFRTIHGYPAATGVGIKHGGVILDFCAVKPEESVIIKPINNPNQVNAYNYGQQVLKGFTDKGRSKNPPQFERALLLVNRQYSTLFISGTASIIGQETIGIENIEKQTVVTIENISKLADSKRIGQMTGNTYVDAGKLILLRVYIKNQEDFAKIKSICNKHFQGVPTLYIEADICRDNLLVEIEAEFLINN
jgi:enamine deaminase RidA (YjgF/YER057c/UK114 family)